MRTAKEREGANRTQTAVATFTRDWVLYLYEGAELAIFMISACDATVVLFHPGYPALHIFPSAAFMDGGMVYFTAPLLGMLGAAEVYLRSYGPDRILRAKLHPDPSYPCPFFCHFPFHRHSAGTSVLGIAEVSSST